MTNTTNIAEEAMTDEQIEKECPECGAMCLVDDGSYVAIESLPATHSDGDAAEDGQLIADLIEENRALRTRLAAAPTAPAQPCGEDAANGAPGEREALRDKWKIVDGDCREGANGLITYHVDAFDEGYHVALTAEKVAAQEPVAWMWRDGGSRELSFVPDDGSKPVGATACIPLYAAPQPAQPEQSAVVLDDERAALEKIGREFKDCFGHITPEEALREINARGKFRGEK